MKILRNFLIAVAALATLAFTAAVPGWAHAATPAAREAIAAVERQFVLSHLWEQIVANASAVPLTEADQRALVAKAQEAQEAINAKDYARADEALADLLDLAVVAARPKTRA